MANKLNFKNQVKNFLSEFFINLYLIQNISRRLIFNKKSFLHQSGWISSIIKKTPVDENLKTIPWFNYSFYDFISKRLNSRIIIFEFGSGYSSIYFSKIVKKVYSVEHDSFWVKKIKLLTSNNHYIIESSLNDKHHYINSLKFPESKFDIVFVDGRFRKECCIQAIKYLSEKGVVILDDSERIRYQEVFLFMENSNFKELTFRSFKPNMNNLASTTVFYRVNNCLNI